MRNVLKHVDFYKACSCMTENKDVFMDTMPTAIEAAAKLSEWTGLTINAGHIPGICEATGIDWKKPRKIRSDFRAYNAVRVLTTAVKDLHTSLGVAIPEGLQGLIEHFKSVDQDHKRKAA